MDPQSVPTFYMVPYYETQTLTKFLAILCSTQHNLAAPELENGLACHEIVTIGHGNRPIVSWFQELIQTSGHTLYIITTPSCLFFFLANINIHFCPQWHACHTDIDTMENTASGTR